VHIPRTSEEKEHRRDFAEIPAIDVLVARNETGVIEWCASVQPARFEISTPGAA
jgi:hypothetical protein